MLEIIDWEELRKIISESKIEGRIDVDKIKKVLEKLYVVSYLEVMGFYREGTLDMKISEEMKKLNKEEIKLVSIILGEIGESIIRRFIVGG